LGSSGLIGSYSTKEEVLRRPLGFGTART
jgi:hypothetical protein